MGAVVGEPTPNAALQGLSAPYPIRSNTGTPRVPLSRRVASRATPSACHCTPRLTAARPVHYQPQRRCHPARTGSDAGATPHRPLTPSPTRWPVAVSRRPAHALPPAFGLQGPTRSAGIDQLTTAFDGRLTPDRGSLSQRRGFLGGVTPVPMRATAPTLSASCPVSYSCHLQYRLDPRRLTHTITGASPVFVGPMFHNGSITHVRLWIIAGHYPSRLSTVSAWRPHGAFRRLRSRLPNLLPGATRITDWYTEISAALAP